MKWITQHVDYAMRAYKSLVEVGRLYNKLAGYCYVFGRLHHRIKGHIKIMENVFLILAELIQLS